MEDTDGNSSDSASSTASQVTNESEDGGTGHFDDISSLDEANEAVFEQNMALRIQPRAPSVTRFYFIDSGWKRQKAGQEYSVDVNVETVRKTVKRHLSKNGQSGGGGVKAVDKEELGKYA